MARAAKIGKGEMRGASLFLCNIVRRNRITGYGVAIAEPFCEVAILAALRAKRAEILSSRFSADRAWLAVGRRHGDTACAKPPSSASFGSVSIRMLS